MYYTHMKHFLAVSIMLHHSFVKNLYGENILFLYEFCTTEQQHKNTVIKYNVCAALSTDNMWSHEPMWSRDMSVICTQKVIFTIATVYICGTTNEAGLTRKWNSLFYAITTFWNIRILQINVDLCSKLDTEDSQESQGRAEHKLSRRRKRRIWLKGRKR